MSKKDIPGQMSFIIDLSTDARNYVVQSNDLVLAKQGLKLNSAKIIRTLIMQIKPDDDDLKTYGITITELSKLLNVSRSNLYRDIKNIVKDIEQNGVSFVPKDGQRQAFINMPWCDAIGYDDDLGLLVKINPLLKPYLLGLKDTYTQYQLFDILKMKSIYGVRLYEILTAKHHGSLYGHVPKTVKIKIADLRRAMSCEDKYERISSFKERVLDVACKSIEDSTYLHVTYEISKDGGKSDVVIFNIVSLLYQN